MPRKTKSRLPPPPNLPHLPPELWTRILALTEDPIHLWTSCRVVSRSFRSHVEFIFTTSYLRHNLTIEFFRHPWIAAENKPEPVSCHFSRFSSDPRKTFVVFRETLPEDEGFATSSARDAWAREYRMYRPPLVPCAGRWVAPDKSEEYIPTFHADGLEHVDASSKKEYMSAFDLHDTERTQARWTKTTHLMSFVAHAYSIALINDIPLPGFRADAVKKEVCFEWRGALARLFREQMRLKELEELYRGAMEGQGERMGSLRGERKGKRLRGFLNRTTREIVRGERGGVRWRGRLVDLGWW